MNVFKKLAEKLPVAEDGNPEEKNNAPQVEAPLKVSEDVLLGLDIGTEYVKVVIASQNKKGELEVVGSARARQSGASMHSGAIADIPAVVSTCEKALLAAE